MLQGGFGTGYADSIFQIINGKLLFLIPLNLFLINYSYFCK